VGQRCGYRRAEPPMAPQGWDDAWQLGDKGPAPVALLSAPAARSPGKHKGWELPNEG